MCCVIPHQNQLCVPRKQDVIICSLLVSLIWTWMWCLEGGEGCFFEDRKLLHLLLLQVRSKWGLDKLVHLAVCPFESSIRSYSGEACRPGYSAVHFPRISPASRIVMPRLLKGIFLSALLSLLQQQLQCTDSLQIHTVLVIDLILPFGSKNESSDSF